jgi:hypothetical protein
MMMLIQTNNQHNNHSVRQLQIQVQINFLFPSGSSDLGKKSGRTSIEPGIGYEKDVTFHNPDYTKPIQFQSVGLLQESSHSPAPVQEQILICQHCQRVGHMEDQCFDLHPCEHCGQHNHPSDKCFKRKTTARVKNHYGWIPSWRWSSIVKKICQSYRRIHSRVLTHLAVKGFASSHLVPDRGEQHQRLTVRLQVSKSYQSSNNKRA